MHAPSTSTITQIYDIQGAGHISPLLGQTVTTEGIVTAIDSNGLYRQAAVGDGTASASDAIFVFTGSTPSAVQGHLAQVAATVQAAPRALVGTTTSFT